MEVKSQSRYRQNYLEIQADRGEGAIGFLEVCRENEHPASGG